MVLHADGARTYAVSFPRDLWVDIPGRGKGKINSALNEGPQKVIDTLHADFGIDVNHYVQVDFRSFQTIVDAIGGIRIWVPHPARNNHTGFTVPLPGCWPLDGAQALAYVRSRAPYYQYYIDGKWVQADPIPDIGRIERQQAFVKKLGRLAVADVLDHPLSAKSLADKVVPDLAVDRTFDRTALDLLARAFVALHSGNGLTFDTVPWAPGRADGQDVLFVKQPDAGVVLDRLKGLAPLPAPTTTTVAAPAAGASVRPVDVRVRVLNGSGQQGAAASAEQALTRLGFVDGGIGNDPRGSVARTEVRYRPGDEAKAALVAAHVPGAQLVADASLTGDVVVVLGHGFTGIGTAANGPGPAATTTTLSPLAAAQAACDAG